MLWIKSFHIIAVICWFAVLFYLPRLFVYHAMSEDKISKGYMYDLKINEGSIRIWCTNWSEEKTRDNEWEDDLNIAIDTKNFIYWVNNQAY